MKFGFRVPSFKKRLAARTSWKRVVRHSLGFKAPRGWGWLTNPRKAAYNRVYNRTTVPVDRVFSGGRSRRRGSSHDGAAVVLVLGIIIAAVMGVYLLIAGAVVFMAWLIRLATKNSSTTATTDEAAIAPPSPSAEYQPLAPIDPNVFGELSREQVAANAVFGAWLQQVPKAPTHGSDLIRKVEVRTRLIGRLTTNLEGRRFSWQTAPISGRQTIGAPPLDPARLDPWNPPTDLKAASRYVAACWNCAGEGRVACGPCAGSGRLTCASCSGSGKYYGTTANGAQRLLNCKGCKGKGSVACGTCTRGAVDCGLCRNAKKLECWLAIDASARQDVQIEPDGDVTIAFPWGHDGVVASRELIALDARLVDGVELPRLLTPGDLPTTVPEEWRRDYWSRIQALIQPGEHVSSQAFTLLAVPSTEVTYTILGESQAVAFEGLRMLAPPPWQDVLFARRARMLARVKLALAALPIAALAIYCGRGSYFMGDRAGPLVAGVVAAAAVTAVCAYAVVWYATLGRKTGRRWAISALVSIAIATTLAVLVEPSTARARGHIDAGRLDAAKAELGQLGSADDPELAPLWADVHLNEALAATSCPAAVERAAKISSSFSQRARAQAHADDLAVATAEAAFQASRFNEAKSALGCASDAWRGGPGRPLQARIAIGAASSCTSSRDWACVFERADEAGKLGEQGEADGLRTTALAAIRSDVDTGIAASRAEKDLEQRVQIQKKALDLWTHYLRAEKEAEPGPIVALKAANAKDEKALERQQEIARQREAAAEQQRLAAEERARKAQEAKDERDRKRRAAEEARQNQEPLGLLCCDGAMSPSCSCGGSHQGCCSHHGGVCGCR